MRRMGGFYCINPLICQAGLIGELKVNVPDHCRRPGDHHRKLEANAEPTPPRFMMDPHPSGTHPA